MTNPRAIYFNDKVSVGYIRGAGLLEMVAQDATLGSIFYVVHQDAGGGASGSAASQQCLRCHLSWDTLGVPGLSVLSTLPRKSERDYANGFFVDHYRPIEERWGGWYVTGKRVPARHMGNLPLIMAEADRRAAAGARVARRAVRSQRLPHAVQRHRGADGARSPGALQQSRHARHVGGAARPGDAHRRGGPDALPITCCSWTKRRSPAAASKARQASRRSSRRRARRTARADRCASSI